MLNRWLFTQIDNSSLVLFRVFFGILITLEAWGAIATGWVKRVMVEPSQTFNFIGLDFLQALLGPKMYLYFFIMGIFGVFVTLGYKYRFSMFGFTIMWASVYFLQKSSYNNHYYLLLLICIFMLLVPANRYLSIDARKNPALRKISMPCWVKIFIILQLGIVYTYAAVAKLYPDWLDLTMPTILMDARSRLPYIGFLLKPDWVPVVVAYFGIFFDLLIVPLLLWRKTRLPVFILAIFFHLFNSAVFHIGIFPYLSLAFCLFFFSEETIHKRFLKRKPFYNKAEVIVPNYKPLLVSFFGIWFIVQIGLPLRHWLIKDNVLWTEEGHRLSWRMMLRTKNGIINFKVIDKQTGNEHFVNLKEYLSKKQRRALATKPDMIWQFSQRLQKEYAKKGKDIAIYVDSRVSVNQRPYRRLIDNKVDMAAAEWNYFWHNPWILPSNLDKS